MASTPKVVRRLAKKAQREVSNYFGFPVHARVNLGAESKQKTKKKGGKPRINITLSRKDLMSGDKMSVGRIRTILDHELFHGAHDSYLLRKTSGNTKLVSEAVALLANAERKIRDSPDPVLAYKLCVERYKYLLERRPQSFKYTIHADGMEIALSILERFPERKERKKFLRDLLEHNAAVLKEAKAAGKTTVGVGELGKLFLV